MHGSLPLSFCASMFDCVFSTIIYAVLLATNLTIMSPCTVEIRTNIWSGFLTTDSLSWDVKNKHFRISSGFFCCLFFIFWLLITLPWRISGAGKHFSCFREEVDVFRIYLGKLGIDNTNSIKRMPKHTQTFWILSSTHGTKHSGHWSEWVQQVRSVISNIVDSHIQMLFLSVWWTEQNRCLLLPGVHCGTVQYPDKSRRANLHVCLMSCFSACFVPFFCVTEQTLPHYILGSMRLCTFAKGSKAGWIESGYA